MLLVAQGFNFATERSFVDVTSDLMIDLDNGCERTLSETGHRPNRKFAIRRGCRNLVRTAFVAILKALPHLQPNRIQQPLRTTRVASRAPTNANAVPALWF